MPDSEPILDAKLRARIKEADYKLVGPHGHSAVKLCHWAKASIRSGGERVCYKQKFYGIHSHRCLQMTPSLTACTLRCDYCWRDFRYFRSKPEELVDPPSVIVEESLKAQRLLLSGLGGVSHDKKLLKEAQKPAHVAISLDGEPTLYPKISELIAEWRVLGCTTFLVTNGTRPDVLQKLAKSNNLPTQLYLSLSACDEEMFMKTQHPVSGAEEWEKIQKTLKLFPTFNTRRVIRLTLVKNLNMLDAENYAALIKIAQPHFIEAKAWMAIGQSRSRLPIESMPKHAEIREFSEKLAKALPDYEIKDESPVSRIVLLAHRALKPPPLYK